MNSMPQIVFIDNFDSFTYNLVDQFRSLGYPVTIFRNHLSLAYIESAIQQFEQAVIVLSPGPGIPANAGCMPALIQALKGKVPMIGICLGHQAIVEAYGGVVSGANEIVHGKSALVTCLPHSVYQGLPLKMTVARYHSLVATQVPESLSVIAHVDHLVMAVVNNEDKVIGYQFHPESILTTQGATLLKNTMDWATEAYQHQES